MVEFLVVPVDQGNPTGLAAALWPPRNAALHSDAATPTWEALGTGKKWFFSLLISANQSATAAGVWFSVVKEDEEDGKRGAPVGTRSHGDYSSFARQNYIFFVSERDKS